MKDNVEKYLAKGQMIFVQTLDGLKECRFDRDFYINEYKDVMNNNTENDVDYLYNSKFLSSSLIILSRLSTV